MLNEDCYRLLKISPDANEKTIRKAYRERSKELHPDVNPSSDAAAQFSKLAEAMDTLVDPIQRLKHDDRFGYVKKARNQNENAKQRFSDYQKEKASGLVKEWSDDYNKAMEMRERQRNEIVARHKRKILILWFVFGFIFLLFMLTLVYFLCAFSSDSVAPVGHGS